MYEREIFPTMRNSLYNQTPSQQQCLVCWENMTQLGSLYLPSPSGTGIDMPYGINLICVIPRWEADTEKIKYQLPLPAGTCDFLRELLKAVWLVTILAEYSLKEFLKIMFGLIYLSWGYILLSL